MLKVKKTKRQVIRSRLRILIRTKLLLQMQLLRRFLVSYLCCKARRHMPQRKTGLTMNHDSFSGQSKNTAEVKTSLLKSWIVMIGCRLLASYQAGMTHNANTSSTKIRSLRFKRVTGSSVKTKNLSDL